MTRPSLGFVRSHPRSVFGVIAYPLVSLAIRPPVHASRECGLCCEHAAVQGSIGFLFSTVIIALTVKAAAAIV